MVANSRQHPTQTAFGFLQSAHQPHHQHNHNNGSKHSVTEHLISPCKLTESVYAYLHRWECRFEAILSRAARSIRAARRANLAPEMQIQQGGLKTHERKRIHLFW